MSKHINMRINEYNRFTSCSLLFLSLSLFSSFLLYDISNKSLYLCNDDSMNEELSRISKWMEVDSSLECINEYSLNNGNIPRYNFLMYDNSIRSSVYIATIIFVGIMYGVFFVSVFVYNPYMNAIMKKEDEEEDNYNNYLREKYPYEYKYTFNKDVYDEHMRNVNMNENVGEGEECEIPNYICDTTPDGIVFMRYNRAREGFEYWSNKIINYMYLETLARKYVKTYSCYHLYRSEPMFDSDDSDEDNGEKDVIEEEEEDGNEEEEEKDEYDEIFLKKKVSSREQVENKIKNKYIHSGPITDFDLLNVKDYKGNTNKLSFADFKKLFKMS